jgi:ubiquinol-cytochrome c reductase cytochrome b subunit
MRCRRRWFIRCAHSTGASAFFIVVYLHVPALLTAAIAKPRELLWIVVACLPHAHGGGVFLLPAAVGIPYWGAQVIVNLLSTVPIIGDDLGTWIRGDFTVSDVTLNRFSCSTSRRCRWCS